MDDQHSSLLVEASAKIATRTDLFAFGKQLIRLKLAPDTYRLHETTRKSRAMVAMLP